VVANLQPAKLMGVESQGMLLAANVSGDPFLLKQVLRNEWNFDGFVVSDWGSISEMVTHGFCVDKKEAAMKAEKAQAEIARQQKVYDNLQSTFAKEQQANQVKIEMMKSGVKVNLANEILFPSGSSELNKMGVEVLSRAAGELKKSPYQTVVAGFTDDQKISNKLKAKYPSNWELAAARAASVVRLLEKEGVAPAQLIAISFGENSPVASNDTPEGRSRNRRIEIILRPVAVTMD